MQHMLHNVLIRMRQMKICLQVLQLALTLNFKSAQVYILEKTASLPVTDNRRLEKACNIMDNEVSTVNVLPQRRPCGNHAKRCINGKTIQCLPNFRSMYPSICNSFPVIRTASAKNRCFHVPQPTFLFPLETPLRLSRNVLHGWKDN